MVVTTLSTPETVKARKSELLIAPSEPALDKDEMEHASRELIGRVPPQLYRKIERGFADPPIAGQQYALVSFVPSEQAKPDASGIYGMMKVRGVFATADEANLHAETIVRNVDSQHTVLTTYVGRPFPIMERDAQQYGAELVEVRMQENCEEILEKDKKKKKEEDTKIRKEMQKRQEAIMKPQAPETSDPLEAYVHLRVKRAQLATAMEEWRDKIAHIRKLAWDAHNDILKEDERDPTLHEKYKEHYIAAREACGLKSDEADPMMRNLNITEEQLVHLFGR